jgi:hypothetical protein
MKFLGLSLVLIFSFALLSMSIVQNAEARGADEPCSYLKPNEWTRDSSGNCVRTSSASVTSNSPVTGRSIHEPCSYLNPTKYVRDPHTGLCHQVIIQAPTPIKAPAPVISASTYSTASILPVNTDSTIASIDLPNVDSTPITYLYGLGFVAFFGFLAYEVWKRIRKFRRKESYEQYRSRRNPRFHLRDIQTRFLQLRDEDPDLFLHEINAKLKKYSRRGNELYEAYGWGPDPVNHREHNIKLKILKYRDPSTDRIYVSFVPAYLEDPDEAMAWKFSITKQQYQNLVDEG